MYLFYKQKESFPPQNTSSSSLQKNILLLMSELLVLEVSLTGRETKWLGFKKVKKFSRRVIVVLLSIILSLWAKKKKAG